jgi:hypothetical protein
MTNQKPEELVHPNVCPQKLCFHWRSEGDYIAPGPYDNIDEAMENKKLVEKDHCGCSFGRCIRDKNQPDERDWYEPCEPEIGLRNDLKLQCFICKESIENENKLDPCSVQVSTNYNEPVEDQKTQTFFCHFSCFKKVNNDDSTIYLESMSTSREMEEENKNISMKLEDLTQIIYEQGETLGILERLFCTIPGQWTLLRDITLSAFAEEIEKIEELLLEPLLVCWTEHYFNQERSRNCIWRVVIFATKSHYEFSKTLLIGLNKDYKL